MAEDAPAAPVEATPAPVGATPVSMFVGIDLGVLNVVVASSSASEPTATAIAVNDVSNRATPATICFDGKLRLVGDSAEAKASQMPKQTVTHLPSVLGSKEDAKAAGQRMNCLWGLTESGNIGPISFGGRENLELRPASVTAALLRRAVSFATGPAAVEDGAAQTFEAAISVPDGWGEAECASIRAAVDILGWKPELVHVIPFSQAITTAYAQRMGDKLKADESQRIVAFADVGFSQTSITISKFTAPAEGAEKPELGLEVLASATAPVGTQTLVVALADRLCKEMKEPVELRSKKGARLTTALHKSLKELSMLPDTRLAVECFFSDEGDYVKDLTRSLLLEVAGPQLQAVADLAKKTIADAGVSENEVDSVELIGGGKSIPAVQQMLSDFFPEINADAEAAPGALSKRLRFGLDAASAMATGTTLYAGGKRNLKSKFNLAEHRSALADEATLTECRELEVWMAKTDKEEVQRLEKANELESFIYEVRGWLSGPDRALLKPDAIEPILDKEQLWFEDAMYDETIDLEVYTTHLGDLKKQLEEHAAEFFEKRRKEKEAKDKYLDEAAAEERQRRQDCGMNDDKDDRKMAKSERIKMAAKNKEEGNTVFKAGNLEDASGRYMRALQHLKKYYMLDLSPEEKGEGDAIFLSVQLNLAQVYLKLAAQTEKDVSKDKAEAVYVKAKTAADEALTIDAENVKAKYRKASAMDKLGDIEGALKVVKSVLKDDAENSDFVKLKERLDKLQSAQNAKAKKMYGKMFG